MEPIVLRDIAPGDAAWLIQRHAELYAKAEGFDGSFEILVADILQAFLRNRETPAERAWIAEQSGTRLGSIFCVRQDATTAKLRLFLLEPSARGQGLGARMLSACLDHARAQGFARMSLWTHESHRAACALYAKFGFRLVSSKPVRSFGVDLIEQAWEIDL